MRCQADGGAWMMFQPWGVSDIGGYLVGLIIRASFYLGSIFGVPYFRKPPHLDLHSCSSGQKVGFESGVEVRLRHPSDRNHVQDQKFRTHVMHCAMIRGVFICMFMVRRLRARRSLSSSSGPCLNNKGFRLRRPSLRGIPSSEKGD